MKSPERVTNALTCWVAAGTVLLGLLILAARLREVQVESSADYRYDYARQSVRRVQTDGVRGRILDRHGEPLAMNRPSLSIVCRAEAFQRRTWKGTADAIAREAQRVGVAIGLPSRLTDRQILRHVRQALAMPLVVWRDVDGAPLARFAEREREFPGFEIVDTRERVYPQGRLASHLLGYVGRDRGDAQAGDEKFNFYQPEMRGRAGLEIYYDGYLRGVPGERRIQVDARGFTTSSWTVQEPRPGPDLALTLDAGIQRVVERELAGQRGACAVIDPRNGDVLALASAPGYDPNEFVPVLTPETYERHATDPAKPLLNRAVGGGYAPGSTFKPITALAGLAEGWDPLEPYTCYGVYTLGEMNLHCARRWGHGDLDMRHALKESCNPYFCHLGSTIGTNAICRMARTFGLGAKTGLDFGVDRAGIVPDAEWKLHTYAEPWYSGDVVQMSIGQGFLLVTPLQMARVAGAIGTGVLVTPRLKADLPKRVTPLPIPADELAIVRDGMRMVVDGGTGRRGGEGVTVPVSGKTGTAEVGRGATRRKNTWFIAYAPSTYPSVAIAMVIENGESGGGTTAPRVGAILRHIFP